nr:hypothetical protein C26F1.1 - Caenorhabditis elegans [Caenorhabditis elegans]
MHRSFAAFSILLVAIPQASSFLFGGGCCGAPAVQSCCGSTSWAYAPPQVIGYERIPLYAKVPMPPPPTYAMPRQAQRAPMIQSQPYYPPPPPPPPPAPQYPSSSSYQHQGSYYSSGASAPMDNVAHAPGSSVSSVSNTIPSIIPPPQDKYNDGDVIISVERYQPNHFRNIIGYQQQPQQQFMGQVEQGVEITPDQINSGYQPQQQMGFQSQQQQFSSIPNSGSSNYGADSSFSGSQPAGLVQSVASSAAFEAAGVAPSARRLRKFKN